MNNKSRKKLASLEVIRVLAFVMVMLAHTEIKSLPIRGFGGGGVELFLLLNGFLMAYNYYDRTLENHNIKNNFVFSIKKIAKLYPLHMITMMMMMVFDCVGPQKESLYKIIATVF